MKLGTSAHMETKHKAKWLYQVVNSYYVLDAYMRYHVQPELRSLKTTRRKLSGGCVLYKPEQFFRGLPDREKRDDKLRAVNKKGCIAEVGISPYKTII